MTELSNSSALDISRMTSIELGKVWSHRLSERLPDHLPTSLLAQLLIYRLQVERHGGLSKRTLAYLKMIENGIRDGRAPETPYPDERKLKLGCQMIRQHEGIDHRVTVVEGGYQWNSKTFTSLSAVAKAITGTNWNGHRFFGLKINTRPRAEVTP